MKISTIRFKEVTGVGTRLDAPVHLCEGVSAKRLIAKCQYHLLKISDVSERVWHAGRWRRVYVTSPKHGITLLGSSAILKADLSNEKMISLKYTDEIEDKKLQKGWTLISCSGTIGKCAFANAQHAEKLASQHVIRLKPNNILRGGLVYAYLASKYGYSMLTQGTFGSVIQHIEPQNVEAIPIPKFPDTFQQDVDNLVQEAARLREEATCALEKAKDKVSKCCNNEFDNLECSQTNIVSVSSIVKSFKTRLDPPVYINKGVAWSKRQKHAKRLGDLNIKIWYPGIFKRAYVKNGLPYIKGSSVFNVNPFISCDHLSKARTPQLEELWLKEGMLLISCAGACGLVKMITKEYEDKGAIGSPDIIRLISNDELCTTEYLYVYLQLQHVYDFMQSLKYGSVIERFDIGNVENIPIVIPSKELSEEITAIVRQYMDCTYRAFNAEEKAIHMVEQEIEKWNKH